MNLLIVSERSRYFRNACLEARGLVFHQNLKQIDFTRKRINFLKISTLVWVVGTNPMKDNDMVISHESYQIITKSLDELKYK